MNPQQEQERFLAENPLMHYSHDEQCGACDAVADICPFHWGQRDGMAWMARMVYALAADPEIVLPIEDLIAQRPDLRPGGGR